MAKKNSSSSLQRFKRKEGFRSYKRQFIICTEGARTEPDYFNKVIKSIFDGVVIRVVTTNKNDSSPNQVLQRMKRALRDGSLSQRDEAWIIIDRDEWSDEHLALLRDWEKKADNYNVGISNPSFEYWMLLHFEEGNKISKIDECLRRLGLYIPDYNKNLKGNEFKVEDVKVAIERARRKDRSKAGAWPSRNSTTVYKLLERIEKAHKDFKNIK